MIIQLKTADPGTEPGDYTDTKIKTIENTANGYKRTVKLLEAETISHALEKINYQSFIITTEEGGPYTPEKVDAQITVYDHYIE